MTFVYIFIWVDVKKNSHKLSINFILQKLLLPLLADYQYNAN